MAESGKGSVIPGLFAAFAVGAMVGAGLALLYAPRSGQETRELLCKKTRALKDAAGEALEHGKGLVGAMKDRAGAAIAQGQESAREVGDAATRSV